MRYFNKEGPVVPAKHYHIPPLSRIDREEVLDLIARERYFVLHAPRQTGKTTTLGALRDLLNETGEYRCVYANVEPAAAAKENVEAAVVAILDRFAFEASMRFKDETVHDLRRRALRDAGPHTALQAGLALWAASSPKPLVLLIDEIDSLVGDSLLSVLRQLRSGYWDRPDFFPHSVILCGVRDVRDYRITASSEEGPVSGGSAFNIKAESLRMGDFSEDQVRSLLGQHADATGQSFTEYAAAEVWRLTRGQPWLVNALAYECCFAKAGMRDRSIDIADAMVREAAERLILRRDTHLDQLAQKLKERRVRRVIEPMIAGADAIDAVDEDDLRYVRDLGLVTRADPVAVANPIYREVIPRQLTYVAQASLRHRTSWYVGPDGRLRMDELMTSFQSWFRENSEQWLERFQYREAGPHLILQAFLHRVVNSGGRIRREYGVGRRRMDLGIVWPIREPGADGRRAAEQRVVVECKVLRRGLEATLREGLKQAAAYMDTWNAAEGHLAVFDRREGVPWDEKIFRREETSGTRRIAVWGM